MINKFFQLNQIITNKKDPWVKPADFSFGGGGMSWKRVTNMIKHDTNVVDMEKMKCNDNVLTQMKEGDILKKRR